MVSDLGRVIIKSSGKEMTLVITNNGYFRVCLEHDNKSSRYHLIHRAALMELFGIEMTQPMTATLSRLYGRVTRRDVSDQYDF